MLPVSTCRSSYARCQRRRRALRAAASRSDTSTSSATATGLPLERAARRGELPVGLDIAAETDQLVGSLYSRILVTDDPIDHDVTARLVDAFVHRIT